MDWLTKEYFAGKTWPQTAWWWPKTFLQFAVFYGATFFIHQVIKFIFWGTWAHHFGLFLAIIVFAPVLASSLYVIFWMISNLILPEFFPDTSDPSTPSMDFPKELEARLWKAIEERKLFVPPQEVMAVVLKTGEELFDVSHQPPPTPEQYEADKDTYDRSETIRLDAITQSLTAYLSHLPKFEPSLFKTRVSPDAIYGVITPLRSPQLLTLGVYTANIFQDNVIRVTKQTNSRELVYPQNYRGDDVAEQYLIGTALLDLFRIEVPFTFDPKLRFEHMWLVGNSGHGKTEALKRLLAHDFTQDCSVIVIEPKEKLINELMDLKDIRDRLILIDCRHFVPAVNMFAFEGHPDIYNFFFSSLLDSPMTDNQETLFTNCVMLLRHVPNATIKDLYDLLDGQDYSKYYFKLPDFAQRFFQRDFDTSGRDGYKAHRDQVKKRLNALMIKYPFNQMFVQSEHKIDIGQAMADGKIILVNASERGDEDGLGEAGARVFGRFFLAMAANATAKRTGDNPKPCYLYLDEADFFCRSDILLKGLLSRARQNNVGVVLAHRTLDEMGSVVPQLEGICSIVMAGGVRATELRAMQAIMECPTEMLQKPKHHFGLSVRGHKPLSVYLPPNAFKDHARLLPQEFAELIEEQKAKYGIGERPSAEVIPLVD